MKRYVLFECVIDLRDGYWGLVLRGMERPGVLFSVHVPLEAVR